MSKVTGKMDGLSGLLGLLAIELVMELHNTE